MALGSLPKGLNFSVCLPAGSVKRPGVVPSKLSPWYTSAHPPAKATTTVPRPCTLVVDGFVGTLGSTLVPPAVPRGVRSWSPCRWLGGVVWSSAALAARGGVALGGGGASGTGSLGTSDSTVGTS